MNISNSRNDNVLGSLSIPTGGVSHVAFLGKMLFSVAVVCFLGGKMPDVAVGR